MSKPRLLDLFCKAGGCTKGYQMAGFEVVGVDIDPQPRYVGDGFVQMCALEAMRLLLAGGCIIDAKGKEWRMEDFDAFAASPPCEGYSLAAMQWRIAGKEYPDLVDDTRQLLAATSKPFVIENVPGAPLKNPILINGAMFGIRIHRPRLFEIHGFDIPFFLQPPPPKPVKMGRKIKDGDVLQPVGNFSGVQYARNEMSLSWMTQKELAHAIPPAYTKMIGERLIESL